MAKINRKVAKFLPLLFSCALASCGGGSNETAVIAPTPPPAPSQPSPAPEPTPLPLSTLSYENRHNAPIEFSKLPERAIVTGTFEANKNYDIRTLAFADFFGNGTYSAITAMPKYANVYKEDNPLKYPDSPAEVVFLKRSPEGKWQEATQELMSATSSRDICITPGFAEIADLNNDKRPDVFFSCTGLDFYSVNLPPPGHPDYPGNSDQFVLLSQPDEKYAVKKLDIGKLYSHQASLVDLDSDGNVDILSVDPSSNKRPVVLFGQGNGNFRLDKSRFPAETYDQNIYSIRAFKQDGRLHVMLAGHPPDIGTQSNWEFPTKIYTYENGVFRLKTDLSNVLPVMNNGKSKGMPLDFLLFDGNYYGLFVSNGYASVAIAKIKADGTQGQILKEYKSSDFVGYGGLIKIDPNKNVITHQGNCNEPLSTTSFSYEACSLKIPIE